MGTDNPWLDAGLAGLDPHGQQAVKASAIH